MIKSNSKWNLILTIFFGIAFGLIIITFSIGLPIYCRFFYYAHISALDLESASGYTYQEIKQAYDCVLNYLTLPGFEFSTGVMPISKSATEHFMDTKVLFNLNLSVLIVSSVVVLTLLILNKKQVFSLVKIKGLFVGFYSAVFVLGLILILCVLVSLDFNQAFVIFHNVFFPGKDNWQFNPKVDHIIRVLPSRFFMNCAILIGASIILISAVVIIFSIISKKKSLK